MGIIQRLQKGLVATLLASLLFPVGGFAIANSLRPVSRVVDTVIPNITLLLFIILFIGYGAVVRLGLNLPTKPSIFGCLLGGGLTAVFITIASYFGYTTIVPNYQFFAIATGIGSVLFLSGYYIGEKARPRFGRELLLTSYFVSESKTSTDRKQTETIDEQPNE